MRARRLFSAVAALVAGLLWVVIDPSGPSAMAYQAPPPSLAVPGSVISSGNLSSPDLYNKVLTNAPRSVTVGGVAEAGSKLGLRGVAGGVGAGLIGFEIGTSVGTHIASAVGLPTTGDFWCDLATAVASSDCGVGPSPLYLVNSDVTETEFPGWAGSPLVSGTWVYCSPTEASGCTGTVVQTLTVDVKFAPPPLSQAGTGSLSVGSGVYPGPGWGRWSWPAGSSVSLRGYDSAGVLVFQAQPGSSVKIAAGSASPVQSVAVSDRAVRYDLLVGTTVVATYYPEASPDRPPVVSADPQRWWRTTWECSVGAGGSLLSAAFRESAPEWPGFPSAQCDAGAVTHVKIGQVTEGLTTTQTMFDWTADPAYVEWAQSDCVGGGCQLLLSRIDAVTGSRLSCFDNPSLCVSWFSDPAKAGTYECTYGGEVVALDECNVYSPTFNSAQTNQGINYADPETGTAPSTGTGTGTDPGGEPQDNSCPPPFSWSALVNPWYYYKGMVCALQDAFVPQTTPVRVQTLVTEMTGKSPFPELGSIASALSPPADGSTCMRLSLPLSFVLGHDQPFLDSCTWSDPVSALLRDNRGLLGAAVWVSVISPMAWWAWKTYAPASTGSA